MDNSKSAPTVFLVGFKRLYTTGHIQGAQFHPTGGSAEGLKELTGWAGPLPRTTNLVIYRGCCPMRHCPNVRPAHKQLAGMGFSKLRVLILPTSFAADWAAQATLTRKATSSAGAPYRRDPENPFTTPLYPLR